MMVEKTVSQNLEVSKNVKDLFDMACDIALRTKNDGQMTKKASGKLRFFWCKPDGLKNTDKQNQLQNWIKTCIQNKEKVNFQILLFTDLMTIQNSTEISQDDKEFLECVKNLLRAGVDIRYSNVDDKFRISLHGNIVHLAVSENIKEPVVRGMNYYGETVDDGLVKYFNKKFDNAFKNAQPVVLLNDDQIQINAV